MSYFESRLNKGYSFKDFPYSSHWWMLKILENEQRKKILDIGIGQGFIGKFFKDRNCEVIGVELNSKNVDRIKDYYHRIFVQSIEQWKHNYKQYFDWIIYADILEHLSQPEEVLIKLKDALKDEGKIIISLPNIVHLVYRIMILFGQFKYMDKGILDRSHLRFFTLKSALSLVRETGYKVKKVYSTPLPLQLIFPFTNGWLFSGLHKVHYALSKLWKGMFSYQFIIEARKEDEVYSND